MSAPTSADSPMLWHTLSIEETLGALGASRETGFSMEEAGRRLVEHGPNELKASEKASPLALLIEQFKNVLVIVLLIAIVLSAVLGHEIEAITIGIIVVFAVLLGFIQEYRAERAIEALKRMAAPLATVLRGGQERSLPAREVVPGDILFIKAGGKVPADVRLLEAINLQTDEAPLTGESLPVEKQANALLPTAIPIGDRRNMAYAGTVVTYGRGTAVAVATGMQTEVGRIAGMLETLETSRTPLQENLDRVGHTLAKAALGIVAVISLLGFLRGEPLLEIFVFGVALAVAVVPEALPAVVTISLAIGVQKMAKRHALMRRLPAVETLGSTTVICSDKTGTLTRDEMTVRAIWVSGRLIEVSGSGYDSQGTFSVKGMPAPPDAAVREFLTGAALCSDARLQRTDGTWQMTGDPTEGALVVAAAKAGLLKTDLEHRMPRTAEIPFTSETKRMTTIHRTDHGGVAYSKGAPEAVVATCTLILAEEGERPLSDVQREEILVAAKHMAEGALRVLAVARKVDAELKTAEHAQTFLGLAGMIDPPRPEAKQAIRQCHEAGIRVVMITGDHPVTASAIARELGILTTGKLLTGPQFEEMDDEVFRSEVEKIQVYARVSPSHKLRVVTALQSHGHVVAMTGDGVNDAPALKKAGIGIAMGITGTDVTKEASAMTLTDDNFASIVAAVEEGRGIFGNIKKYLMYLLASNIGEILIMTGASVLGMPLPLSAVQILYINLATDGLPALALAVDPPEPDLMKRPPRDPKRSLFTRPVIGLLFSSGTASMIINLAMFAWALRSGRSLTHAMTMVFVMLVVIEFCKAYSFRSDRHTIFQRPFRNRWLNLAILWEILLLSAVIYTPFLQRALGTVPLSTRDWTIILFAALTIIPVIDIVKWMVRRGWLGEID